MSLPSNLDKPLRALIDESRTMADDHLDLKEWAATDCRSVAIVVVSGAYVDDFVKFMDLYRSQIAARKAWVESPPCSKRGLVKYCNDEDVAYVQLRSQTAGGGKKNVFEGDCVWMCAACRSANTGTFKLIKKGAKDV